MKNGFENKIDYRYQRMDTSSAEYIAAVGSLGTRYMIAACVSGAVEVVYTDSSSTAAIARWYELMETRSWTQVGNHNLYVADVGYEVFRVEPDGTRSSVIGSIRRDRKRMSTESSSVDIPQL